jgi:hypothetical protein
MPKATCSDSDCGKQSFARGLCQAHYNVAYRSGTLPPRQLTPGVHSLTSIDREARTADCSICGPQVPIRVRIRKGSGGIECMTKRNEGRHRWNRSRSGASRKYSDNDRKYKRYRKYKLTQDGYDRMVADQQGRCAICHSEPPVLAVDHDHETGAVRGLLCRNCNLGIGLLRDDIDLLRSATRYLTIHRPSAA